MYDNVFYNCYVIYVHTVQVLHAHRTWSFGGHEVVNAIGIALPKLDWVVQQMISSCSGCLYSCATMGNSASLYKLCLNIHFDVESAQLIKKKTNKTGEYLSTVWLFVIIKDLLRTLFNRAVRSGFNNETNSPRPTIQWRWGLHSAALFATSTSPQTTVEWADLHTLLPQPSLYRLKQDSSYNIMVLISISQKNYYL